MNSLDDLASRSLLQIWPGVRGRRVEGERITLAVVELEPDTPLPDHHHESEQLGLCLSGTLRFTVGEETRDLGPGGTWRILSNVPHSIVAGPRGAVVIDVFAPIRSDWDALPLVRDPASSGTPWRGAPEA